MPDESKFYYPLQDEAAHLDRVFHDLVTISNDEDDTYKERITDLGEELFIKGVINEDGYIHFIFDDVQSSRPIEVNAQEVPVGDGEDWVKPSDFYTAVSIHEYKTTDTDYALTFGTDITDSPANWIKTDNYIFTKMQIIKDDEIANLLNEESILSCMQIGSYKVQPLTGELIETMKSFFTNGEDFFNEHKYEYYCGSDRFNNASDVTSKYFLYFDVDENDQEILVINKLTRKNWTIVQLDTIVFSNIHIFIDLYDGDEFQATVNVDNKLSYHNKIADLDQTIIGKEFSIKEYSRTAAETRYFGSEFSSEDSYYAPQLVFGSDPRGRKGFENSCNITLRGRGKAFLDDDAYAHFMGNSFLKMEGTSKIIARNEGDLLVEHGKTILGQLPKGIVPDYEDFIRTEKVEDKNVICIIDDGAFLGVQQAARVLFSDGTNFQSVGHAWVSLSDESRLDMAGQSRIAGHTTNYKLNNALFLDNHDLTFQSGYNSHINANKPTETWIYNPKSLSKISNEAFLYKHYPTLESVPPLSAAAKYFSIDTRMQTFIPIFDNSIVFINVTRQNANLNTLNAELHTIFPEYNIDDYYLLGDDDQLANLLQYFQNTPAAAELVPEFFTRDYYYLTKAERDILYSNYPSSPVRNYLSKRCLEPLSVKQDYDFKTKVIDKLNTLSMFNIDCLQIDNPRSTYIFYDMIEDSVPDGKSATSFVLKKTETEPRLSGHQNNYSTYWLNKIFNDRNYYVGKSEDYDPSSPNSTGYYYLSNIVSQIFDYKEGTVFRVEGPGTSVILGDNSAGRQNIRVSGGFINLDITGGLNSDTMLKLGANKNGKLQLYITGDDAFFEIADNSHFEMHNNSNFILDGNGDALKTKTGVGHRDHLWMTPWSKPQNYTEAAPTLQLYHNSSLSMYGTQDSAANKYCNSCNTEQERFNLDISLDLLTTYANSSDTELNAGAQFLLDYIYNGNPVPGDRYDDVSILDFNIASSIFAIFIKMNQGPTDSFKAKSPLIDFTTTATSEIYDSSLNNVIEPGTVKCIFTLTEADSSNDSADCRFDFKMKNFLMGSDSGFLRVAKQPNSPLMELAENAEFRMWGNTYLKITDDGITIKDNSVNEAYTFTVAELKAAIEGGGSGPSYPDAEDIQV